MTCKVEQDLNNHIDQMECDDERESMVQMMAQSIMEGDRFPELFDDDKVFFAAVEFIKTEIENPALANLKKLITEQAEKMADKILEKEGR